MSLSRFPLLAFLALLGSAAVGCLGNAKTGEQNPPIRTVDAPEESSEKVAPPEKKSPPEFWVKLETTKGDIVIECHRDWSPYGADRFYELVTSGFYDGCRIFRVLPNFVIQMGINGDPQLNKKWRDKIIPADNIPRHDKSRQSNLRGFVSFAQRPHSADSRTTQFFINSGDNSNLDNMHFTPFGKVIDGMAAVDSMYDGYREEPLHSSDRIEAEGNKYLDAAFPKLDAIKKAIFLAKKPEIKKPPAG